jgi:hypothetical protein
MSSDRWLRSLGQVARDEAKKDDDADAKWSALARGELGADDVAALEALAADEPAAAERLEAYRPLDDAAKDRIAARLPVPGRAEPVAPVVPLRAGPSSRASRAAARGRVLALFGLAAAVMLWVAAREKPGLLPSVGPIPTYTLEVSSGDRATRGAEQVATDVTEVAPDSRLEIRLRPAHPTSFFAMRAFVRHDGVARAWVPRYRSSTDSAIVIAGTARELFGGTPGTWDVAIVVALAADIPPDADVDMIERAAAAGPAPGRLWQPFFRRVRVVGAE